MNSTYAIKVYNPQFKDYLLNEIRVLKSLDHKHIVKYVDHIDNSIVLEYIPNKELFDYL